MALVDNLKAEISKTKWQILLDSKKGCVEYNPSQSFALHVMWIVRSPTAAKEMIEKGFRICSQATMRDTPTTLAYIFRISHDQRLAIQYKKEIKTFGQHPHYQPSYKSMNMGVPRNSVELKLKHGGINLLPLSWNPEELIEDHAVELDFDPIVLECTEIYLDNRSFYEHSASHEWMDASPEILKACRSLKPTTYCLGNPTQSIWDTCLEPYLKAIRISTSTTNSSNDDHTGDSKSVDSNNSNNHSITSTDGGNYLTSIQPGVFFHLPNNNVTNSGNNPNQSTVRFFLEINLIIHQEKVSECRNLLSTIQQDLQAPYMIILPVINQVDVDQKKVTENNDELRTTESSSESNLDSVEMRWMTAFSSPSATDSKNNTTTFQNLCQYCVSVEGRVIVFDNSTNTLLTPVQDSPANDAKMSSQSMSTNNNNIDEATTNSTSTSPTDATFQPCVAVTHQFLEASGLNVFVNTNKISTLYANLAEDELIMAGYHLHPLYQQLVSNDTLNYQA